MRPLIKPALRRVWRDATTLQFGLDPERAVVLSGLDVAAGRFVRRLDGTRDADEIVAAAPALGVGHDRARQLLDLLSDCGLLEDAGADRRRLSSLSVTDRDRLAPDLASLSLIDPPGSLPGGGIDGGVAALYRRGSRAVLVVGAGRVGASIASLLAAAGVGYVVPADPGPARAGDTSPAGLHLEELGARREDAARRAMRRLSPRTRAELPPGRPDADVVVLAPTAELDTDLADRLVRTGIAHLLVTIREARGVVGPFVLPGRSSCLRCADLHRADRDPAWPRVAAQLAAGGEQGANTEMACDTALATLVAAQATLQVLAVLDGASAPPSVDGTLETRLPDGRTRRRSWGRHPACGCAWAVAS